MVITDDILLILNCAKAMEKKILEKYPDKDLPACSDKLTTDITLCLMICRGFLEQPEDYLKKYAIIEWTETKFVYGWIEKGRLKTITRYISDIPHQAK